MNERVDHVAEVRRRTTPALEEVAREYTLAACAGYRTTAAVAEKYGVSRRTASNWVRMAREAGLLDTVPTTGNTVGVPPKVLAVATALGVSVEALSDALIRYAGGDLRIKAHTVGLGIGGDDE